MWSKLLTLTAVTFFAFYSTALGQTNFTTNWNPTGEGCVDPTGFVSCYNDHSNTGVSCQTACANNNKKGTPEYNTCMDACEALWLAGNVGCWLQSCWNQVCFMPNSPSSANQWETRFTLAHINSLRCRTLMARAWNRIPMSHSTLPPTMLLPVHAVSSLPSE
jgi:hypothetical protein